MFLVLLSLRNLQEFKEPCATNGSNRSNIYFLLYTALTKSQSAVITTMNGQFKTRKQG